MPVWFELSNGSEQLFNNLDTEIKRLALARYACRLMLGYARSLTRGRRGLATSRLVFIRSALALLGKSARPDLVWPEKPHVFMGDPTDIDRYLDDDELIGNLLSALPAWHSGGLPVLDSRFGDYDWHATPENTFEPDGFETDASVMLESPLFAEGIPERVKNEMDRLRADSMSVENSPDRFWIWVLDGLLEGMFSGWELLSEVLRIDEGEWLRGPDWIAEKIAEINASYEVSQAAHDVEAYLAQASDDRADRNPLLGHNNPPREETLPIQVAELEELRSSVRALQEQIMGDVADNEEIKATTERIEATRKRIGAWLAAKLDIAVDEFFKELGKWGGRIAVGACGAAAIWFFGLVERLGPLLEALRNWLALTVG